MSVHQPEVTGTAEFAVKQAEQRARLIAVARGENTGVISVLLPSAFVVGLMAATFLLSASHQVIVLMLFALGIQLAYSAAVAYSQRRVDALLKLLEFGQAGLR